MAAEVHQLDASRFNADVLREAVAHAPLLDMKALTGLGQVHMEIDKMRMQAGCIKSRAAHRASQAAVLQAESVALYHRWQSTVASPASARAQTPADIYAHSVNPSAHDLRYALRQMEQRTKHYQSPCHKSGRVPPPPPHQPQQAPPRPSASSLSSSSSMPSPVATCQPLQFAAAGSCHPLVELSPRLLTDGGDSEDGEGLEGPEGHDDYGRGVGKNVGEAEVKGDGCGHEQQQPHDQMRGATADAHVSLHGLAGGRGTAGGGGDYSYGGGGGGVGGRGGADALGPPSLPSSFSSPLTARLCLRSSSSPSLSTSTTSHNTHTRSPASAGDHADYIGRVNTKMRPHTHTHTNPSAHSPSERGTVTYKEFLDRLMRPESFDVLSRMRRYIASVVGPSGGMAQRRQKVHVHGGVGECEGGVLREGWGVWVSEMERVLRSHGVWRAHMEVSSHGNPRSTVIMNHVEKYVMDRIGDVLYRHELSPSLDTQLARRLHELRVADVVTRATLDISMDMYNPCGLAVAQQELRRMARCRAPVDKLQCVLRAVAVIMSSVHYARALVAPDPDHHQESVHSGDDDDCGSETLAAGGAPEQGPRRVISAYSSLSTTNATSPSPLSPSSSSASHPSSASTSTSPVTTDDLLPLLILVVLHADVPEFSTQCRYIMHYHNPQDMIGRSGCYFAHLQSAVEFLMHVDASKLSIDPTDFEARMARAVIAIREHEGPQTDA